MKKDKKNGGQGAGTTYLIWLTRPRIPHGNTSLENFPEESDVATSNASRRARFRGENAEKLRALNVGGFNIQHGGIVTRDKVETP